MVIQHPEEQNEVKKLKEKIAQLEKAVAQLTLDKLMLESTLEVVEEELGELPKKSGAPRSSSEPTSEAEQKDTPSPWTKSAAGWESPARPTTKS